MTAPDDRDATPEDARAASAGGVPGDPPWPSGVDAPAGAPGPSGVDVPGGASGPSGVDVPGGAPRPSGLRNPEAAVRGIGSGTLAMETIVLLLAIQPIRLFAGHLSGWGITVVLALAVLCAVVAGSMKRRWAWHAGTAVQALLIVSGLLHWSLAVLGLIFGAAWAYASYVRRTILG